MREGNDISILHIAAHLGGGVGKAHASLRATMPPDVRETYCLLEPPRDTRYADDIEAFGGRIVVARDLAHVGRLAADVDIVQFEFWNHPKLYEALALAPFPLMRTVFWSHISGLFRPVIAPGLFDEPDRFVFTTPASLSLVGHRENQGRFSSIGSGFAPAAGPHVDQSRLTDFPLAYLGTVDFVKMSPVFFEVIDRLDKETRAALWGGYQPEGEVIARAGAMQHPERTVFRGHTADPSAAFLGSNIFFYPLQPDHYGTAENALVEAMCFGLVPVVLANPAECAIVDHMKTGLIAHSADQCVEYLERLLADSDLRKRLALAARSSASVNHRAEKSRDAFIDLWTDVLGTSRHSHDFASAIGTDPLAWYRSTLGSAAMDESDNLSKGTLAHFKASFPDARCWNDAL